MVEVGHHTSSFKKSEKPAQIAAQVSQRFNERVISVYLMQQETILEMSSLV